MNLTVEERPVATAPPTALKIIVAGGFGAGKTTLVASISETRPLHTEAPMTETPAGHAEQTTTVALDFGRITLDDEHVLYLFGMPGQPRFSYVLDDVAKGALGAVVLVDARRPAEGGPAADYFTERGIPFIVAVNHAERLDGDAEAAARLADDVRAALGCAASVPVRACDARDRESVKNLLISLVEHVQAAI